MGILKYLRFMIAVAIAKGVSFGLRGLGYKATSLPGLIVDKLDRSAYGRLAKQCKGGVILVTGTNGKTTTSRMIAQIMQGQGELVHNQSGSNLRRGHVSAFLQHTTLYGRVRADYALLETDEAVLPDAMRQTKPKVVVIHNLFRDQLDRYGEVDTTVKKWRQALQSWLPADGLVVMNVDDPNIASLSTVVDSRNLRTYGIEDELIGSSEPQVVTDAYLSPISQAPLEYSRYYLGHLGHYKDGQSDFSRPLPQVKCTQVGLNRDSCTGNVEVNLPLAEPHSYSFQVPLPGVYTVYNALAALTLAETLGVTPQEIQTALSRSLNVFGRFETVTYKDQEIVLCLIKNPAGASAIFDTLANEQEPLMLGVAANDNFADGTDVSWYYDAPCERIAPLVQKVICSGVRAADMAVRWKYTGVVEDIFCETSHKRMLESLVSSGNIGRKVVFATYTAALELQDLLHTEGWKQENWNDTV